MNPSQPLRRCCIYLLLLTSALSLALCVGCRTGRISGTYISREQDSVEMLQLTQAHNGQITGVLSSVEVDNKGNIHSESSSITNGSFDDGQLTLKLLPGIFGTNISGTKKWNTIRFDTVGSNGDISSDEFHRDSPEEFQKLVGQLRFKAKGISMSLNILSGSQGLQQAVHNAEQWISNAEMHAQRISSGKEFYARIDNRMQSLIERERATSSSATRAQITAVISQGDALGGQMDAQENQLWDDSIGPTGAGIRQKLSTGLTLCKQGEKIGTKGLQTDGVSRKAIESWDTACRDADAEWTKYEPIYQHIMEQRADLKSFQVSEQSHRKALVDTAYHLE